MMMSMIMIDDFDDNGNMIWTEILTMLGIWLCSIECYCLRYVKLMCTQTVTCTNIL